MNTRDRLNVLSDKITDKTFLKGYGLGNEISFYVFDYPPEDELVVREGVEVIINKYLNSSEVKINEINLLEVFVEKLKSRKLYDRVMKEELKSGKELLIKKLKPILKPENISKEIAEHLDKMANIIFITGVGSVYPFIRAHNLLNNLHDKMENIPLVMFFPGKYDMQTFRLFEILEDNNYYRAFRIAGR